MVDMLIWSQKIHTIKHPLTVLEHYSHEISKVVTIFVFTSFHVDMNKTRKQGRRKHF